MIPFDVDPVLYYPTVVAIIGAIAMLIHGIIFRDTWDFSLLAILVFLILAIGSFYVFVMSSFAYTDTITICHHTEGEYMKVIDTNENLYYVNDDITQLKIKDNITVKVEIENKFRTKYIYHIDAPITCGNSTCAVSPT